MDVKLLTFIEKQGKKIRRFQNATVDDATRGVPSIVATLGTLGLFRGVMLITTGGEWIEELPEALKALGAKSYGGLSVMGGVSGALPSCSPHLSCVQAGA